MQRYALLLAVIATIAGNAHAESELVIAIRYLHAQGTSHSHLYLYREDGKLLRQLTNDNSGQDSGPIFSPDGETIVFTREMPNNVREFWSVNPRGTDLKKARCCAGLVRAGEKLAVFHKRRTTRSRIGRCDKFAC